MSPLLLTVALLFSDPQDCGALERNPDPAPAIACYQRFLEQSRDPRARANALTKTAWLYAKTHDYDQALSSFRQTLTISREIGDRTLEANTINFMGLLHQFLGDHAAALDAYRRALAMARELGDRHLEGLAFYHLGWLHFVGHDEQTAVKYYNQSLAALRETSDRKGEGITLAGLGMAYSSLGQYEKALQYEDEALPLLRAGGDRRAEADALDHAGLALTFLHRPSESIAKHTAALQIRKEIGDRWGEPFSLSSLARAERELGDPAKGAGFMAEVIDILEAGRRKLSTRRFRGSLFAGARRHYELYIELLSDLHDDLGALSASERARARLTLDAVQESLARAETAAGGSLLKREQSLRDAIERRERERDEATTEKARVITEQIEELAAELRATEDKIAVAYPKLALARNAEPLPSVEIQSQLLDSETAVVEYFLGSERSFVWVLTRAGIESHVLPARKVVEPAAVRLHDLLAEGDQRSKRYDIDRAAGALSTMLIAPLTLPGGIRRLIIVPDGALFYVPFAALSARGRMLIDDYEISMAPSASALVLLRRAALARSPADATVAVFADPVFRRDDPRVHGQARAAAVDPDLERSMTESGIRELRRLPATRAEAETIVRSAPGRTRKALDFEASRRAVLRENLGRYRVVHFATHALLNAQHPELSGIVLSLVDAGGAPINGFLRVHDLYRMNGTPDLVVLSACHTAGGKELRGEGIVGLVSGFMHAGTPRVVASYWNVKDQPTAVVMRRFYHAMFSEGLAPAAALRSAQRSMRSEERWRSPYNWASFALFGLPTAAATR